MILYFADRRMNIIGQASTNLPDGLIVYDDLKTEDVETGVSSFECRIPFNKNTRTEVQKCTAVGNYILRSNGDENEYYTIIESEESTRDSEVYIYAEDAGLDLLNEIVGGYAATDAQPIDHYINKFAYDTGFEIGINEVADLKRKLSWEGEVTITERLASVATQFDNAEIDYSFKIKGLRVVKKYINIYKQRGQETDIQLRLNKEIDNIVTTKSIANIATALRVTGGVPEDKENPITLDGYKYDDGDFFLEGTYLKSRKAVAIWSRYLSEDGSYTGHICKRFNYDTTSQSELCNRAISELKKLREVEVNYEVDTNKLPEGVKIGDRVNIIDDAGGLYVSARILRLETSIANNKQTATIGEYLIKSDGISKKVADMAAEFANYSASLESAYKTANEARNLADEANTQAESALNNANQAAQAAQSAKQTADAAFEVAGDMEVRLENVESDSQVLFATCTTAGTTVAKVATLASGTLTLKAGAIVAVKFTYANSVASPTLNVSGTGAKSIQLNGQALSDSSFYWSANSLVTFVYDGSYWCIADASAIQKATSAKTLANNAANAASNAATAAANAAKTATNYMSFDSTNGLLVGNNTSGTWSGYRAQVKSDSFNILDSDGTEVATYGANKIELGKNSQDTTIDFCNGLAQILYDATYECAKLYAEHLRIDGYGGGVQLNSYLTEESVQNYSGVACESNQVLLSTDSYEIENGQATGVNLGNSMLAMIGGRTMFDASEFIVVNTPTFTVEGDIGTTGSVEAEGSIKTSDVYYDKYDTVIRNGLAAYSSSGIDPNTTLEELVLTNHINGPKHNNTFFYIRTVFYITKSETAARSQLAIPYKTNDAIYHRYYLNGNWSSWRSAKDDLVDYITQTGTDGIWTYVKWNSGKAECWGKKNYGTVDIKTTWAGWYTSTSLATAFPSGLFSESPTHCDASLLYSGGQIAFLAGGGVAPAATNTGETKLFRPDSISLSNVTVGYHAIGKWK